MAGQDSITYCKELAKKFLDKSDEMLPLLNTTGECVSKRTWAVHHVPHRVKMCEAWAFLPVQCSRRKPSGSVPVQ